MESLYGDLKYLQYDLSSNFAKTFNKSIDYFKNLQFA